MPSQLYRKLFWRVTYGDIKTKIKLHIGERQALIVQEFETLHKVVSLAFGSEEKERPPEPQKPDELRAAFGKVFG